MTWAAGAESHSERDVVDSYVGVDRTSRNCLVMAKPLKQHTEVYKPCFVRKSNSHLLCHSLPSSNKPRSRTLLPAVVSPSSTETSNC